LVDAADRDRFNESKAELDQMLNDESLSNTPIVVLGNKIDKRDAASEEELRDSFGLHSHLTYGREKKEDNTIRPVEVFMCSVAKRMGYAEGFRWLSQFLN